MLEHEAAPPREPCQPPTLSKPDPSPREEARIFWRMRLCAARNLARQALATARLRLSLILTLTGLLWIGLFVLFAEAFHFLQQAIPDEAIQSEAVRAIFNIFFASLMGMLLVSAAILVYSMLYRSAEVRFLLTTPARSQRIFLHKFHEAMFYASWGFVLLGSPMLVAYGVVADAGAIYYLVLLPYQAAFALIPGAGGAMVCLVLVRLAPRLRWKWVAVSGGLVALAVISAGVVSRFGIQGDMLTASWFQEVLERFRFSEHRLLPSWWLATGLLEAAHAGWDLADRQAALVESLWFLALTISNALVAHQFAMVVAGRCFRSGYSALEGARSRKRRAGVAWVDRAAMAATAWMHPHTRQLLVKDLRMFRRDPVQWLQFLIFMALLCLYFVNVRRLSYDVNYAGWVNMISFLNLAVIGLILATFMTRFIFPLISLEGRRFWILGLLPVRRDTILWGKFLFAFAGSLLPTTLLILLSDLMLRVHGVLILVHVGLCLLLCSGLSAIAVGLGARMPNLREDSPSRIAAGFGGTLNLVISTAYIAAVLALTGIPCHRYLAAVEHLGLLGGHVASYPWKWVVFGSLASAVLGAAMTAVPLAIGLRAFRRLEF